MGWVKGNSFHTRRLIISFVIKGGGESREGAFTLVRVFAQVFVRVGKRS